MWNADEKQMRDRPEKKQTNRLERGRRKKNVHTTDCINAVCIQLRAICDRGNFCESCEHKFVVNEVTRGGCRLEQIEVLECDWQHYRLITNADLSFIEWYAEEVMGGGRR